MSFNVQTVIDRQGALWHTLRRLGGRKVKIRAWSKREILEYFQSEYGLKYESRHFSQNASATGAKTNYYSTCNRASQIGYTPSYSSMESLKHEAKSILQCN